MLDACLAELKTFCSLIFKKILSLYSLEKKRECSPELCLTSPLNHLLSTMASERRIAYWETFQHHLQSGYIHHFPLPNNAIQRRLIKRKCAPTETQSVHFPKVYAVRGLPLDSATVITAVLMSLLLCFTFCMQHFVGSSSSLDEVSPAGLVIYKWCRQRERGRAVCACLYECERSKMWEWAGNPLRLILQTSESFSFSVGAHVINS